MIEFQNVTKLYGSVIGVNDITLKLEAGAYGLLGPNGSGKTTLINLIVGQLRPTIGEVKTFGENPWGRSEMLRRVGLCPAVDILYPNVTALDWVRYLVELHGFSRHEATSRAKSALELVGMTYAMHRPLGGYSLGMRQRSKLAQALAHDPEMLILDEPFNGLDPVGRHEMTELLRNWTKDGKSLLLASHILHEVEAIRPSFLLICGGRLLASGSPEEVHSMLADLPNEIRVRCDHPSQLARTILEEETVDALRFEEHGDVLVISTRHPLNVYNGLPTWMQTSGVRVDEIRSSDESLQELFTTLMKMHRGEQ
ncbi:MAG: ABC transporter ATP-binding protein [Planctomycetes bacterium]|nr:ABC transporter ATP-binding protein [Planctomycetota bacterium]